MAAEAIPTVIDAKHHPQTSPPVLFSYDAADSGGISVRTELLTHGIHHRPKQERFNHPRPAINRIFLFAKGYADITVNGGSAIRLAPKRIHLVPMNQSFRVTYSAGSVLCFFHLAVTDRIGMPIFSGLDGIPVLDCGQALAEDVIMLRTADNRLRWHALLFDIVLRFAAAAQPAITDRAIRIEPLSDIIAYIHAHPYADCTVDGLARIFRTPRHALSKRFRRIAGIPLKKYIAEAQVQKAKEMLSTGTMSIESIAETLHYQHTPYFYRFFKRAAGMTPAAYRDAQLTS
ncbi:MAG: helix-turn-helix transcriptional regulator [Spirochaetes bacterium]|nr:helix-turn-helix transcriptional regulator [Spirochaetota bacterium]